MLENFLTLRVGMLLGIDLELGKDCLTELHLTL